MKKPETNPPKILDAIVDTVLAYRPEPKSAGSKRRMDKTTIMVIGYELVKVSTERDWHAYHALRRRVLWEARGRHDYDATRSEEYAASNHPLLLKLDGRPIGTTRLDNLEDGRGVVRLVAITSDLQRQGHGRVLSRLVEDYARRLGISLLLVNAAPDAVGYYKKMGWHSCIWDEAELTGIALGAEQMVKVIG
jgi:GNAT superfamily N-acetyltransferase